jgi:hypothetical protein
MAATTQVACAAGDRLAILELERGAYYTLNEVGARIYELLKRPISLASICDRLCREYEVPPARCTADVARLVSALCQAGLAVPAGEETT